MEADWEFEVGGDAPIIDALWPGFVDLRWTPQSEPDPVSLVLTLSEAAQLPCLAATLKKLNAETSPVWTSKCDFWPALEEGEFDPDELDAPIGSFPHAAGCYIDMLPRSHQQWLIPDSIASSCMNLCARLHSVPLRCCGVNLIVRTAQIAPGKLDVGITAYIAACGATPAEARHTLEAALTAFADAICPQSTLQ